MSRPFKIIYSSKKSQARVGELETEHGKVTTPVFMPVGTLGAVKTLTPEELEKIGAEIILGNTYHLYLRPGEKLIKKFGGLHKFMNWERPMLTDSGGFQVFSLGSRLSSRDPKGRGNLKDSGQARMTNRLLLRQLADRNDNRKSKIINHKFDLVKIKTNGVEFRSHLDGSKHFFTPEKVIDIQRDLGSDIMMVLDVCTEYPATRQRAQETMELTHQWAKKSIAYWNKIRNSKFEIRNKFQIPNSKFKNQNDKLKIKNLKNIPDTNFQILDTNPLLFGIIQGSTYQDLRTKSAKFISSLPFDGIAVGGVSVGEGKKHMYEVMKWVGPLLPKEKPRYIMGIGEPEDIIEAVKNGFDMFDCVLPTRLARHGVVWTNNNSKLKAKSSKLSYRKLDLRKSIYRIDQKVLDLSCLCYTCRKGFSRAYLSHLIREGEMLGFRLATIHNLHFIIFLVREVGQQIKNGKF